MNSEKLKQVTIDVMKRLSTDLYHYREDIFVNNFSIVEVGEKGTIEDVPVVTRKRHSAHLELTVAGSNYWEEKLTESCDEVGVNPEYLYPALGTALLELANVISYSHEFGDPIPRLRRIDKAFRDESTPKTVSTLLSDRTGINIGSIVESLDIDDYTTISKLRYGIGVALKGAGLTTDQINIFAESNIDLAIKAINNYKNGVIQYLDSAIFLNEVDPGDVSATEVASKVYRTEFPFLQVASTMPMNVNYLLNK